MLTGSNREAQMTEVTERVITEQLSERCHSEPALAERNLLLVTTKSGFLGAKALSE